MDAKTMTAVEWLFEKLPTIDKYDPYYADIFQQAKAMEKEHICMSYNDGRVNAGLKLNRTAEEYYTVTYGKA